MNPIKGPLWGSLSDSIGRKKVVIIGLSGFAISLILFSLTISVGQAGKLTGLLLFIVLVSARVLNGLFGSATRPASGGWVADISSIEDRSRAFARLDSGFSMGPLKNQSQVWQKLYFCLLLKRYQLPILQKLVELHCQIVHLGP